MNMTMTMVAWTILLVLSPISMNTIQITRIKRAPQLIGNGVSGGFLRKQASGVSGTMTFTQPAGNTLGGIPQPLGGLLQPQKSCRNVYNRRYRRYFRICD